MSSVRTGLEIGTTELRLVTLSPSGSDWQVQVQVAEPIPPGVWGPAGVQDAAALQAALNRLREQAGLSSARVVISCPENVVVFRRIPMPALKPRRVKQALKLGAGQHIPVPGGDFAADFLIKSHPARPEEVSVLVAAAPRTTLATLYEAARTAHLIPTGISTPALALSWLLGTWKVTAPEEQIAVLVVSGQEIRAYTFIGTTPLAGRTLMSAVADGGEAMLEIRRSVAVDGRLPAKVLIIGDVAEQWRADLSAILSRNFGGSTGTAVEVMAAPPVAGGVSGDFSVAAGEALADWNARDRINLLHARLFKVQTQPWRWPAAAMALLLAAVGLYGAWWFPQWQDTGAAIARADAAAQAVVAADTRSVAREMPVLTEIQRTPAWSRLVGELVSKVPPGVSVQELKEPEGAPAAAGNPQGGRPDATARLLLSGTANSMDQVAAYVGALRGSKQIARVAVASTTRNGGLDLHLNLTFELILDVPTGGNPS